MDYLITHEDTMTSPIPEPSPNLQRALDTLWVLSHPAHKGPFVWNELIAHIWAVGKAYAEAAGIDHFEACDELHLGKPTDREIVLFGSDGEELYCEVTLPIALLFEPGTRAAEFARLAKERDEREARRLAKLEQRRAEDDARTEAYERQQLARLRAKYPDV